MPESPLKTYVGWNPALFWCGVVHGTLACLGILGLLYDTRLVGGINPWIKPIKFDVSIAIYCFTMVVLLKDFEKSFRDKIGNYMALCMYVEIACISFQAARGVRSHYNWEGWFNTALYSTMGIMITFNTLLLCFVAYMWLKHPPRFSLPLILGNGLGAVSLILGSLAGAYAATQKGHTVGLDDGGPGIPFLNWSTLGGDLRVAHFVGLHGVQVLMLLGFLLFRYAPHNKVLVKGTLYGTFWAFCAFFAWVFFAGAFGKTLFGSG